MRRCFEVDQDPSSIRKEASRASKKYSLLLASCHAITLEGKPLLLLSTGIQRLSPRTRAAGLPQSLGQQPLPGPYVNSGRNSCRAKHKLEYKTTVNCS
jgi:hypothetical protein